MFHSARWIHSFRGRGAVTAGLLGGLLSSEGSAMTISRNTAPLLTKVRACAATALLVTAAVACAPPEKDDSGAETSSGVKAGRGHLRARTSAAWKARRGGQEGGRAQRDRAAAGLGQLRRDHQGLRGQVRHQGQLRAAGRVQPGRDQRRQPAEGPSTRARRLRPRSVGGAGQHGDVRAVQGRDVRRHPGRLQGRQTARGSTTTAATCRSASTRPRCRRSPASTTCSSPSTRARSRSTATRPRPARRSPA